MGHLVYIQKLLMHAFKLHPTFLNFNQLLFIFEHFIYITNNYTDTK